MDDYYGVSLLWPLALAVGLALLTLSMFLPEPAAAKVLQVIAFIAFVLAAVFSLPGIV